jgi:hypothetical protein
MGKYNTGSIRLNIIATLVTALVIMAGFAMVSPMFFRTTGTEIKQQVMFSFSISQENEISDWCQDLSTILSTNDIEATVFITGEIAEEYPECILCFSEKVDIGSQSYSNTDLTKITDYSLKLEEVKKGKEAIDSIGNLSSKVFKAPLGATDEDIYSLLSRNEILADFSYKEQYNIYHDQQFIKYDAVTYNGRDRHPAFFLTLEEQTCPIIITFDASDDIDYIDEFISNFDIDQFQIVNVTTLTGLELTVRGSENVN